MKHLVRPLVLGLFLACSCRSGVAPGSAPALATAPTRVYELRTYTAPDGKLDALQRRFRNHTVRIFAKHGMISVGYWVPQDSARANNTLVYVLAYPSREAAQRSWAAFRADAEWQRVRAESESAGPIVLRVESVYMSATDYSPLR